MASGTEFRLRIKGIQYPPRSMADPSVTVQEVMASHFYKQDAHYLFYEEQPEGYEQVWKTRVKRRGALLEIHRQGPLGNSMIFEPGKTYRTEYATPFGTLMLDVVTRSVEVMPPGDAEEYCAERAAESAIGRAAESAAAGEERAWQDVKIVYTLENQGETLGEYELYIERI